MRCSFWSPLCSKLMHKTLVYMFIITAASCVSHAAVSTECLPERQRVYAALCRKSGNDSSILKAVSGAQDAAFPENCCICRYLCIVFADVRNASRSCGFLSRLCTLPSTLGHKTPLSLMFGGFIERVKFFIPATS